MREIKFRVFWHKDKITTSVDTIEFLHGGIRVSDGCYHIGWQGKDRELREFTGLHDKNGKESYEHDIIKVYVHNGLYPDEWIEEIVFEKGQFGIRHGDLYKEFYPLSTFYKPTKTKYIPNVGEVTIESEPMFEIIGNRWDKTELLKEGSV